MSNVVVEIEFLAGTHLKDALKEAKQKALDWDVSYVKFKFNGITFSISRNADLYDTLEEYNQVGGCFKHICS